MNCVSNLLTFNYEDYIAETLYKFDREMIVIWANYGKQV